MEWAKSRRVDRWKFLHSLADGFIALVPWGDSTDKIGQSCPIYSLNRIRSQHGEAHMLVPEGNKRKYPNVGTMARIRALVVYREWHIKQAGAPPVWTAARYRVGINPRTVLLYVPELGAKWYDKDFHLWVYLWENTV